MDDQDKGATSVASSSKLPPSPPHTHQQAGPQHSDVSERSDLLERARVFLASPQVRHEDVSAKRRFLVDKGLSETEIITLLQELPSQVPLVPPRTYPLPPPSNLPNLLAGLFRILTWVAGGSTVLLLVYYRFLLPRLTKSSLARHSIIVHQKDLLSKLTTSISHFKNEQKQSFEVLPQLALDREEPRYKQCGGLDDLVSAGDDRRDIPVFTLLRCALADFAKQDLHPSWEELSVAITTKFPWFESDSSCQHQACETLLKHPLFHDVEDSSSNPARWSYQPQAPVLDPASVDPLDSLNASLASALPTSTSNRYQHTLQSLIDFTGYLTTKTYSLSPPALPRVSGFGVTLSPEEDEVRREIRALKGLVLNRKSFLPPRQASVPLNSS
ncbi:hypothetical protein HETIRDRAFT_472617 [Heterobasidion irregulare TC 32-1]|uniref:Peroxisome membrane anchor protein Pex14p N-terminal domain-containing protein n=1 Tax=Heterobasidion irregulare (strain TC 32-1) TaxID=747525 RepID=W4KFR6_HETIT|nr:uncharacterized protein HETIRDRAFT_472617 [Heterobasidion irregulare TC 32-1]ETW84155.1 hypothetical protein HETIRDRAFT_472617 [Heterobasidion irregulare TC 32-1]